MGERRIDDGPGLTMTALERAVLDKLLQGDDPVLTALRRQLEHATIESREYTVVGFYLNFAHPEQTVSVTDEIPNVKSRFCFGDVKADIEGLEHGAGFLLWVIDGFVDSLEGYMYVGEFPDPAGAFQFQLRYFNDPRDMTYLRQQFYRREES